MTRLSLTEIIAQENSETINVNLQAGRIRVDVKPPAGTRSYATIQGPMSAASVRGTVFEMDTVNIVVNEGTVEFSGSSGVSVLVDSGGFTFINDQTGRAAPPLEIAISELKPDLPVTSGLSSFTNEASEITGFSLPGETTVEVITIITF